MKIILKYLHRISDARAFPLAHRFVCVTLAKCRETFWPKQNFEKQMSNKDK